MNARFDSWIRIHGRRGVSQKFKMCLVASLLSVALLASSAGATLESDVSAIKSDVSTIKTTNSNIYSRLATTNSNLSSIINYLIDISVDVGSIKSDVSASRTRLVNIDANTSSIITALGANGFLGQKVSSSNTYLGLIETQTDQLEGYSSNIDWNLARIAGFLVNTHHSDLEQSSEDTVDQATSMYGSTPNGQSTSRNAADISQFSSGISSSFNTGVSSGRAFEFLNTDQNVYGQALPAGRSGSPFAFFSYETLYDLDPSLQTRSPQPEVVDYFSLNRGSFLDQSREEVNDR